MRDQKRQRRVEFAQRVQDRLIAMGKDPAWLAREIGVSKPMAYRYADPNNPNPSIPNDVGPIAKALSVSEEWLLTGMTAKVERPEIDADALLAAMKMIEEEADSIGLRLSSDDRAKMVAHVLNYGTHNNTVDRQMVRSALRFLHA